MSLQCGQFYEFGPYRLDPSQQSLREGNRSVSLTPKAFQTLLVLVENSGHVVEKEELLQRVWPDTFVEEATLAQNVFTLRKQLRDDRAEALYIETVPKRGYRFVAPVQVSGVATANSPASGAAEESARAGSRMLYMSTVFWVSVAGLLLVIGGWFIWEHFHRSLGARRPMIAVLPVENLTGDPNREYLSDGLTEELIAQLGALDPERLGVIARTSSMTYKGGNEGVTQIGKELGIDYLLEGSVRGSGNSLRITMQLIRVGDQTHMWAESYNRDVDDLLKMQTEIAEAVASSIQLQLAEATHLRLAKATPVNAEAYQAYLKGRFYWNTRTREGLLTSIDYYNQGLQLDPVNARAYAGLADSYNMLAFYGFSTDLETKRKATVAAEKALELDNNLAEAHAALAYSNTFWWWEWEQAERGFLRAIELDKNYMPAHHWYALYLAIMGRQGESVEEIQRAKELDPLSPTVRAAAGLVAYLARRYDQSMSECNSALEFSSNSMSAHYVRGLTYEATGQPMQAATEFQTAFELSGGQAWDYEAALGHSYALVGRREQAQSILGTLGDRTKHGRGMFYDQALVLVALGSKEQAIALLQQAEKGNDPGLIWLGVDPRMDDVRPDPWVKSFLQKSKLRPH